MPTTAQAPVTVTVFDYEFDITGKAIVNQPVEVQLVVASTTSVGHPNLVNIEHTRPLQPVQYTDSNGYWQYTLVPNTGTETLSPANTYYIVRTANRTFQIQVPTAGSPFQASSILLNTPTAFAAVATTVGPLTVNPGPLTISTGGLVHVWKARATQAGAQSIPNATNTLVTLDTKSYDQNSNFSTSTSLYTAPLTGVYQISAMVSYSSVAASSYYCLIYRNGAEIIRNVVGAGAAAVTQPEVSDIYQLTANDTIGLYAQQNTGGAVNTTTGANTSRLAIHYLST